MQKLDGLIAATYTPFFKDYSINHKMIERMAEYLVSSGIKGILACGTTGEGYSLTIEERKKVAEAWKSNIPDDIKLFIHVGHNAPEDVNNLSRHACQIYADGILLSAPNYHKPLSVEDLVEFNHYSIKDIEDIPVYYYHIPSMSGVNFPMIDYLKTVDNIIPNFAGIKYTYENMDDLVHCITYNDNKYEIIFGRDEVLLSALKLGIKAGVGSTYNFMAPLFLSILQEHKYGDEKQAERLQKEASEIINIMYRYGDGIVGGKAIMNIIGLDCGPSRPPLKTICNSDIKKLESELNQISFFDHVMESHKNK